MLKVTLRLYRHQFTALLNYLPLPTEYTFRQMASLPLEELILIDYRAKISLQTALTWETRSTDKAYALTMPLQVARVLWKELQQPTTTQSLQGVLWSLDKELKHLGFNP